MSVSLQQMKQVLDEARTKERAAIEAKSTLSVLISNLKELREQEAKEKPEHLTKEEHDAILAYIDSIIENNGEVPEVNPYKNAAIRLDGEKDALYQKAVDILNGKSEVANGDF